MSSASEEHEFLRAFLDGSPIATFVIDRDHRVSLWNRACEHMTGASKSEVLGRPVDSRIFYKGPRRPLLAELILENDLETIRALYQGKRLANSPIVSSAFEATDDLFVGGQVRTVYFLAAAVHDASDEPIGAIETLQDVTEQRQAAEKLRAHERRLRQLAWELATAEQRERRRIATELHDAVGQALAGIKLKLQLLRECPDRVDLPAVLDEVFELIDRAGRNTRTLTFELCPPMLYDLGLGAALEWLAGRIEQGYGVACRVATEGAEPPIDDDLRGLLFRAARELVINAVKHARCRHITVSLATRGRLLEVAVGDDGIGFDPSGVDRYTEDSGGFGLFSIRERLAYHGGRLTVDSQPDRGARASMVLPIPEPPEERPAE